MPDHDAEEKLLADLDGMDEDCWLALMRWMAKTLTQESPRLFMEIVFRRAYLERGNSFHVAVVEKAVNLLSVVGVKLSA